MAATLGCRLVAFNLDYLAVLNSYPNTALYFTARAAAGTNVLDLTSSCFLIFRKRLHRRY